LILRKRVGERIFVWGDWEEPKLQEKYPPTTIMSGRG